jgi:hypothetical protein
MLIDVQKRVLCVSARPDPNRKHTYLVQTLSLFGVKHFCPMTAFKVAMWKIFALDSLLNISA